MTLRTMSAQDNKDQKQIFSDTLVRDSRTKQDVFNLQEDAPLFDIFHPKLIEAKLKFDAGEEQFPLAPLLEGRFIYSFSSTDEARKNFPGADVIKGLPWQIGKLLNQGFPKDVVIDFAPIGAAFITASKRELETEKSLSGTLIPIWLSYALGPELWGAQGKWTRFHQRLQSLLEEKKLLTQEPIPALYPLRPEARILEKSGFLGTLKDGSYMLTLPWTFPLSGLERLEKVIHEEF